VKIKAALTTAIGREATAVEFDIAEPIERHLVGISPPDGRLRRRSH
jgi:hypothetical protein